MDGQIAAKRMEIRYFGIEKGDFIAVKSSPGKGQTNSELGLVREAPYRTITRLRWTDTTDGI